MMEPDGKYGEELRRILSAAADPLVPAGDGLSRIRERAAQRPSVLAWLTSYAPYLPGLLVTQFRIAGSWIAATAADPSPVTGKLRSVRDWPGRGLRMLREPSAWLRPALAAGGALAIVLLAILLVPRLRYSVDVALSNNPSNSSQTGGGGQGSSAGQPNATGSHQSSPGHSLSSSAIVSSSSSPGCRGSPGPRPTSGRTPPTVPPGGG